MSVESAWLQLGYQYASLRPKSRGEDGLERSMVGNVPDSFFEIMKCLTRPGTLSDSENPGLVSDSRNK